MPKMNRFQPIKCEYLLVSLVFYGSKLNILRFRTIGQIKEAIWRREKIAIDFNKIQFFFVTIFWKQPAD